MQTSHVDNPASFSPASEAGKKESGSRRFINENIAILLERFQLSFVREENRIEYFIADKKNSDEISFSLVFCYDIFARQLHISKFYPGLFRQPDSRYLSAACFYLLFNHCTAFFNLGPEHSIFLQCKEEVFENFYARLKEFSFTMTRSGQGDNVDVKSPCPTHIDIDSTVIIERGSIAS